MIFNCLPCVMFAFLSSSRTKLLISAQIGFQIADLNIFRAFVGFSFLRLLVNIFWISTGIPSSLCQSNCRVWGLKSTFSTSSLTSDMVFLFFGKASLYTLRFLRWYCFDGANFHPFRTTIFPCGLVIKTSSSGPPIISF